MNREAALKRKKKNKKKLQKFYFKQNDFTIGKRRQLCHWHRSPDGWSCCQTTQFAALVQQPVARSHCVASLWEHGSRGRTGTGYKAPMSGTACVHTVSMAEAAFSYIKLMYLSLSIYIYKWKNNVEKKTHKLLSVAILEKKQQKTQSWLRHNSNKRKKNHFDTSEELWRDEWWWGIFDLT